MGRDALQREMVEPNLLEEIEESSIEECPPYIFERTLFGKQGPIRSPGLIERLAQTATGPTPPTALQSDSVLKHRIARDGHIFGDLIPDEGPVEQVIRVGVERIVVVVR